MDLKPIIIIGAGGLGREVKCLIDDINNIKPQWEFIGFVDDNNKLNNTIEGFEIIGTRKKIVDLDLKPYLVCAIGDPRTRKKIISELYDYNFATLIHPSVIKSEYVSIGEGSIICAGTILTTNIEIGKHSILNLGCRIGHDSKLGDYSSLMFGVNIAGEVEIGEGCYFGLNASVINRTNVGAWSIIGAGASVIRDIPSRVVAVGVPAVPIKQLP